MIPIGTIDEIAREMARDAVRLALSKPGEIVLLGREAGAIAMTHVAIASKSHGTPQVRREKIVGGGWDYCCFEDCQQDAAFVIEDGPECDNGTHACMDHVGHLCRSDRESRVYLIPKRVTASEVAAP